MKKTNRFISQLCLLIIVLIMMSGCRKISNNNTDIYSVRNAYPVTVQNVKINSSPSRIVSLTPAVTKIIEQLGFSKRIVGISSYCKVPSGIDKPVVVGSPAKPDIEAIIKLKPDIVITQSPVAFSDVTILNDNDIKVVYKHCPSDYQELVDFYEMTAQILVGKGNANSLTQQMFVKLDDAMSQAKKESKDFSFVYILNDNLAVATADILSGDILKCFGKNIAQEKSALLMTKEEIISAKPDIIFLSSQVTKEKLPDEIKALPAFVQGNVIIIDDNYFVSPTNKLVDLIKEISDKLEAKTKPVG